MIIGIGTDILKIKNIDHFLNDLNDPFITKTFTKKELKLILQREKPLYSFATRFAGKEAVFKALRIGGNDIRLNEIEILEDETHAPFVILHASASKIAEEKKIIMIHISLSYDSDYAIGYAIAEGK